MNDKFLKPYSSVETESRIYKLWEDSGFFNPDVCIEKGITEKDSESFSMVLPPPNVTGRLHLGHALEHSLQDATIRFQRMNGKKTLWVPGTDHAAISTQAKFEKQHYNKEGKSRHDYSRDEFFKMVYEFGITNQKDMQSQMRLLGSSLDWSREAFTLDKKRELAVRTTFKRMYDDGLIYRANKIVNWDPKGQTTISDDEIVYEERKAKLYTFKYSKDFPIPVATTRLETKVGDVAVAVHPEDERYQKYIGQTFEIPNFCGVKLSIKIIADEGVEKDFGTGALGVTPAHSIVDAEMAAKNNLPTIQVINEYAKMIVGDENLIGKKVTEARETVAQWLRDEGLMIEEKDITQNVSTAERTGGIVEPLPKLQWFINVNKEFIIPYSEIAGIKSGNKTSLKEIMRKSVLESKISIMPNNFEKVYFSWIDNLRDWCISRQIIFGHQIPVWYKDNEVICDIKAPEGDGWVQDTDTLDTWFSSGLWTFSTLGWPENTKDLQTYHPTTFMNPGYEILFFWVARMILMSGYCLGQIPFKTVYIHGMVRDKSGKKFSKSLNNGVEPEEIINEFGTDALRMSMIVGNGPGSDISFDIQKVKGYKNFANKLWNITRFILDNTKDITYNNAFNNFGDQKLRLDRDLILQNITTEMDSYMYHTASEKIYSYVWHELADKILEESKGIFKEGNENQIIARKQFLIETLEIFLKLLHPFMPFVTEEIWQTWKSDGTLLMVQKWPKPIIK